MPLIFTYLFAAADAWCLFYPAGFVWPLPALVIALLAHVTRTVQPATWVLLVFSGLLALWSGWAYHRAFDPEESIGTLALGLTPGLQLLAIVLVLAPLLSSVCWYCRAARPNHALQRTEAGHRAGSEVPP